MIHLTLEQAKKLKELGYPQEKASHWEGQSGEQYAFPNLEELINWLGKEFLNLEMVFLPKYNDRFKARGQQLEGDGTVLSGKGFTPLIAVYNLTLAIKQANPPQE